VHGGGFVFDCRALPNPGRLNPYKVLTGLDAPVVEYLERHTEVTTYFERVVQLVLDSISAYMERGFTHLSVSFGCTGGQHRSVYMAKKLAQQLGTRENLKIILKHREFK
jgi:RNase adaptor protein for sRNA GlmZ degradation